MQTAKEFVMRRKDMIWLALFGLAAMLTLALKYLPFLPGDVSCARFVQSVLLQVSPHRFVRWVKITEGSQATDMSAEQLKSCFTV